MPSPYFCLNIVCIKEGGGGKFCFEDYIQLKTLYAYLFNLISCKLTLKQF